MIPTNFEAIFSIFRFFLMASKMAIFRGFGPRHAAGLAERKFFIFDIIIYHPKEHSLRVSAFNSDFFLNGRFRLDILRSALRKKEWKLRKFSS